MRPTLQSPETVTNDAGTVADHDIRVNSRDYTGRDVNTTVTNIFGEASSVEHRSVAYSHILRLAELQRIINHDVNVLIAVRSVLDEMIRLDSTLSGNVEPERHTGKLQVLVADVCRAMMDLDQAVGAEESNSREPADKIPAVQNGAISGKLSAINDRFEELEREQDERSADKLTRTQRIAKTARIKVIFDSLVEDLKTESGHLHEQVNKVCHDAAEEVKGKITSLALVIDEISVDHTAGKRTASNEPSPVPPNIGLASESGERKHG